MKSCAHWSSPEDCLDHRQLIADYTQKFGLPADSMCGACRKAQPERDFIESEDLLAKLRVAGL